MLWERDWTEDDLSIGQSEKDHKTAVWVVFHVNLTFAVYYWIVCLFGFFLARTTRPENLRRADAKRAENERIWKSRVYIKHDPNGNLKKAFSALANSFNKTWCNLSQY